MKVAIILAALMLTFSLSSLSTPTAAASANDEVPCVGDYHHLVVGTMEITTRQANGVRDIREKFESQQLDRIYGVGEIYRNYTLLALDDSESEFVEVTHGYKMCLIRGDDAPLEWSHGFSWPQWMYRKYLTCSWFGWLYLCYYWYALEDPINVVLSWTSFPQTGLIYDLRDWLLTRGYVNVPWGCYENRYVYDEGVQQWKVQDVTMMIEGDCTSSTRYHNRMWALTNGFDAVGEHFEHLHLIPLEHHVHSFEAGEAKLASHARPNPCYIVNEDSTWLDNVVSSPPNDGYATRITDITGC